MTDTCPNLSEYNTTSEDLRAMDAALCSRVLLCILILCSAIFVSQARWDHFRGPPLPNRSFVSVWNWPTLPCQSKWNISLNLSSFDIVVDSGQSWHGEYMTIFTQDQLGLWPYYDKESGQAVNGGLPQLSKLSDHLRKVSRDINTVIPDPDYQGIAVIDWESWKPVFDRNWDELTIYRDKSISLVRAQHPLWPDTLLEEVARLEFQTAARQFMEETLLLARSLRPKGLWGYYGFPDCFNEHNMSDCSEKTKELNDQISWLFESSSALFPSIYLHLPLKILHADIADYIKYRILEAFRKAKHESGHVVPVLPYTQIVYPLTELFLTKEDFMASLGQSAELGCAGVIIWGDHLDTTTKTSCIELKTYIDELAGPLVRKFTEIAQRCSADFCNLHGSCVFHLNSVILVLDQWKFVKCDCYNEWHGQHCKEKSQIS